MIHLMLFVGLLNFHLAIIHKQHQDWKGIMHVYRTRLPSFYLHYNFLVTSPPDFSNAYRILSFGEHIYVLDLWEIFSNLPAPSMIVSSKVQSRQHQVVEECKKKKRQWKGVMKIITNQNFLSFLLRKNQGHLCEKPICKGGFMKPSFLWLVISCSLWTCCKPLRIWVCWFIIHFQHFQKT